MSETYPAFELDGLQVYCGDCLAVLKTFPADHVAMTFTSPPYGNARTYSIGAQRECQEWIDWMLPIVAELVRVTAGPVFINCAGVTNDWRYQPYCEGLSYLAWKQGIVQRRPAFWHRNGIPGSGGPDYLKSTVEYVWCFTKTAAQFPWSDATANGHPPVYSSGGAASHRTPNGERVGVQSSPRRGSGKRKCEVYIHPEKANPGNLVSIPVGGGMLGHPLAHSNEAPFPVRLPEWFIRSWAPPGGTVLDPFGGSGSTLHAARNLGRRGIAIDIRQSQIDLMRRRLAQQELFAAGGVA